MMRRRLVLLSAVMVILAAVAVLPLSGVGADGGYPEPDADGLESILRDLVAVTVPEEIWIAIGDVIDAARTDPSALSALALTSERFTVFHLTDDFHESEEPAGELVPGRLGIVLQREGTDVGVVFAGVVERDDGNRWFYSDAAGLQCVARLRMMEPGERALVDARRWSGVTWIVSENAVAAVPECSDGVEFPEGTLAELQASYAYCAEPGISCGPGGERPPMRSQAVEPVLASSARSWSVVVAGALGALVVAAAVLGRHLHR